MVANNPAIGACPCPIPKCSESCVVKKFANRSTRDTGHRFAGKLYLICPRHGRLGMDATDAMQEHILEHARMFGAADPEKAPESKPAPAPDPAPPAPKAAPAAVTTATPAPRRSPLDFDW